MNRFFLVYIFLFIFSAQGCQTAHQKKQLEEAKEAEANLGMVAGALTGKKISAEDMKKLEEEVASDPEARSAVETITNTVSGNTVSIKYCPIDGKRFSANLKICPDHQVELKEVE